MISQGWARKTGGDRWDFECMDGDVLEGIENRANAPQNALIFARFDGRVLAGYDIAGHAMVNEREKRVALVRVVRPGADLTKEWKRVTELAQEAETYTRHQNRIWDVVEVTPFVVVDPSQAMGLSYNFKKPEIEAQLQEIDPDFQRHNYWCGFGDVRSGLKGIAWTGSWKAWVYLTGDARVVIHELWHCFGVEHSWQGQSVYGGMDIQGYHASTHNAAHLIFLGQITGPEIRDIDSGAAFLIPVECGPEDARPGECRAAKVVRDGKIAILSVHKPQTAWRKSDRCEGFLWVHTYAPPTRYSYRTQQIGAFDEPVTLDNGAVVKVTGRQGNVIRIAVDSDEKPEFPGWPDVPSGIHALDETAAGLWYSPDYVYQGIRLHVRGDQVVGYWFTHLPEGGRVWFVLDGHIEDGTVLFDVYRTDERIRQKDGEARLFLTGPDEGLFKVRCDTFGIDHLRLERLADRGEGDWNGLFETGPYEGFSILQQGDSIRAYHFTYNGGELDWAIYSGSPKSLDVYMPETVYKGYYGKAHQVASDQVIDVPMERIQ